jgi:hypothetical protein
LNRRLKTLAGLGLYILPVLAMAAVSVPVKAMADGIRGFIEWDYSTADFKSTDQTGLTTKTTIDSYTQKYNLYLDQTIFPNLKLDAGGLFNRDDAESTAGGTRSHSRDTNTNLFGDLTLRTPIYLAGIGYNKREETQTTTGSAPFTLYSENYLATFGWKPDYFPSVDMHYTKNLSHDGTRTQRNDTTDQFVFDSRFDPFKNLELRYSATYTDLNDDLNGLETTLLTQTGKITYGDYFFDKRANVTADYTITSRDTSVSGNLSAIVQQQLFPVAGLSGISDLALNPNSVMTITLDPNTALIDGNVVAGAGIDIGTASGLNPTIADNKRFNMALDFFTDTEVEELLVAVSDPSLSDTDFSKLNNPVLAALFDWQVWTSADNQTWTQVLSGVTVQIPPPQPLPQRSFLLKFTPPPSNPSSPRRYYKVVVTPLPSNNPGAIIGAGIANPNNVAHIFVTELQAFVPKQAGQLGTASSQINQILNLNSRVKLLEKLGLNYELSLFLNRIDPTNVTTAFLSNGLSFAHKFSDVFTGNARVAREDNYQVAGHQVSYVYTASLTARPAPTLSDSIIYSGRENSMSGKTSSTNSVFLYNTAELYKGINTLLSGGYTFSTLETGQNTDNTSLNFGLTLIPHRTMNINVTYSLSDTTQTGGGKPSSSTSTKRTTASVAYTPVRALYVFVSLEIVDQDGVTKTTQDYGLNFSPFPDGAVQLHFSYNESLKPKGEGRTRLITPSLRWNIRPGAYMDASYVIQQTLDAPQTSDARIASASLNISF